MRAMKNNLFTKKMKIFFVFERSNFCHPAFYQKIKRIKYSKAKTNKNFVDCPARQL